MSTKEIGNLFSEITGPGVLLVQAMLDFETQMDELGMEAEFTVVPEEVGFTWPQL